MLAALALFVVAIVPVITDQVAAITDNAPGWLDELQHNRQVQELDDEYDVIDKIQDYVARRRLRQQALRRRRSASACAVLGALANAFIVIVLTLYFLASLAEHQARALPPGPGLAPRPGHASSATGSSRSVGGYVSGAFVVALCAGISHAGLPVRRRPRASTPSRWPSSSALLDVIPMIGATHRRRRSSPRSASPTDPKIGARLRDLLRRLPAVRELRDLPAGDVSARSTSRARSR